MSSSSVSEYPVRVSSYMDRRSEASGQTDVCQAPTRLRAMTTSIRGSRRKARCLPHCHDRSLHRHVRKTTTFSLRDSFPVGVPVPSLMLLMPAIGAPGWPSHERVVARRPTWLSPRLHRALEPVAIGVTPLQGRRTPPATPEPQLASRARPACSCRTRCAPASMPHAAPSPSRLLGLFTSRSPPASLHAGECRPDG
jgi:hypothetical protein